MEYETLKQFVENLQPTGIEYFVNEYRSVDVKEIIFMNIKDCSWANPKSLIEDVKFRLEENYGIVIDEPIIIKGVEY